LVKKHHYVVKPSKGLRLLELWPELLKIGRLNVAAIVRSAHARHMTLMITS